jgi:outer membrane protein assembly factor BamB
MVRFKLGGAAPPSSQEVRAVPFALEVDGVDLLGGAGEEPPARILPELLEVLGAVHKGRTRCGQLSLPESQLELCLYRLDTREVELSVVRFARPIQQVVKPLVLELTALTQAARECALAWKAAALAASTGPLLGRQALSAGLKRIEGPAAQVKPVARPPFSFSHASPRLTVKVEDPTGRRFAWDRRARAHLPPLLLPGAVSIAGKPASAQPPVLSLLELTREAAGESGAQAYDEETRRALFETVLELTAALIADHPGLSKNPYLEVLIERSHAELALLSPVAPGAGRSSAAAASRRPPRPSGPKLAAGRTLRRLRFVPEWEKPAEWGDGVAKLLLSSRGVTVAGTHVALGYGPRGEVRFRRMGTHGVASSADGVVLTASAGRLLCFAEAGVSARWLKDHDGTVIGPELLKAGGQLLCRWGNRGVAGFCEVTGRELWRVDPPRARVTSFTVEGERALLPTDAGLLVAVNLADGVPAFRMRATFPLPHRLVRFKNRYLGVLVQGSSSALFSVDLEAAAISWTRELTVSQPSEPLPHKGRIYLAGERDGRGVLALLDGRGVVLWEKPLPLGKGRYSVVPAGSGVLVQDAQGSAALVVRDGEVDWRVGGSSSPMSSPVPPHVARGVAVLPGEVTRVVDLKSGRPLTDLPMRNLMDLKVDRKLRLFALEDHSMLRVLVLTAQLSVV